MVVGNRILMFIRTKKTEEYQPSVFFCRCCLFITIQSLIVVENEIS